MFRWGIIGAGFISNQFIKGVMTVPDMHVEAVASRSGNIIQGIDKCYNSYEELAKDQNIDAVYIGTLHPQHMECAKICLQEKKPVLCEKPVTMNQKELEILLSLAEKNNTFFMEAMWTRFIPAMMKIKNDLQNGKYGKIYNIHITFGGVANLNVRRLFEPKLGGGALLDIGVYGVNVSNYLVGEKAKKIHAWSELSEQGIDLTTCVQMEYPNGTVADMVFSINKKLDNRAIITTDKAEIEIPYFWRPDNIFINSPNNNFKTDRLEEKLTFEIEGNGYNYEAIEVAKMIELGKLESPVMSWDDSLHVMKELDYIRELCGINY